MQTCSSGLCGASEDFWFLSLLLPCDLYAAVLKKTLLFVLELLVGKSLAMREIGCLGVNVLSSTTVAVYEEPGLAALPCAALCAAVWIFASE